MSGFASPGSQQLGMGLYQGRAVTLDPLLEDCIEWWSLNEGSGSRAGGHASISLTDVNSVTSGTGRVGDAAHFDDANSEELTTSSGSLALAGHSAWTVSCWVNADSLSGSGTGDAHAAYGRANPSSSPANVTEVALHIFPASYSHAPYRNKAVFWHYTASNYKEIISSSTLSASTWYHIVIGHDSSSTGAEMWMAIDDGTVQTLSDSTGPTVASSGVFAVGRVTNNAIYMDGLVDELACWSRRLTSAEITRLYSSGNGISKP